MKLHLVLAIIVIVIIGLDSYAGCPILQKLPLVTTTDSVVVEYGEGQKINYFEQCRGGRLQISTTPRTFIIRTFESGSCGVEERYSVHTFTYKVIFEENEVVYYDQKGGRHPLKVSCTESELKIENPEHELTWWNNWKAGQWKIKLEDSQIRFEWFEPVFDQHYRFITAKLKK